MVTHSVNSLPNHKLVNFNVPKYLISNFDNLVRFKRISRTSMLIQLMETYIRKEKKLLEEDNDLNLMIKDVEKRNLNKVKESLIGLTKDVQSELEPPMIPYGKDERTWDDHIEDLSKDDWSDISGTERLFR